MSMTVEKFEPVYLEPQGPARLTEYGKRWLDNRMEVVERHWSTIRDVCKLAAIESTRWSEIMDALKLEGVPVAITSGMSQSAMQKSLDNSDGKANFALPGVVALGLATSAPTSTTTGATLAEPTYTGYAAPAIPAASLASATAATPSVVLNTAAITAANCTAGTSTLLGFLVKDSAGAAAGTPLWYGTLPSTVISPTQTPATIAIGALSLSMTGS